MIELTRAQIGCYQGKNGLDVTVRSAQGFAQGFSPTWYMVWQYKCGKLTEAQYIKQYQMILVINKCAVPKLKQWAGHHKDRVVFLCYCADGEFCHTHLLIDWLCTHYPKIFSDGRKNLAPGEGKSGGAANETHE